MPDDPSENDLKTIWRNQPTEPSTMTLKLIRNKVQELHAKTRWELIRSTSSPLPVIAISVYAWIAEFRDPIVLTAFIVAIVWSLVGQYFIHRGMWSAKLPGDAALSTGLQFYRQEVERRRYLFNRVMPWAFGPTVLALGAFTLPLMTISIPKMMPFLVLLGIWFVAMFFVRMGQQQELQREIDALNDIESENRQ